ncbi:hypothetical protein O3P69_013854 [Scylla paramamosain]|uniref:Uncharacterized protein n=1 Tax=Scylla paramamosain TaxID=85552 RepID=A0AAW0SRW7_SCYPA
MLQKATPPILLRLLHAPPSSVPPASLRRSGWEGGRVALATPVTTAPPRPIACTPALPHPPPLGLGTLDYLVSQTDLRLFLAAARTQVGVPFLACPNMTSSALARLTHNSARRDPPDPRTLQREALPLSPEDAPVCDAITPP